MKAVEKKCTASTHPAKHAMPVSIGPVLSPSFAFENNRSDARLQMHMQTIADSSPRATQLRETQPSVHERNGTYFNIAQNSKTATRAMPSVSEAKVLANQFGLPAQLKAAIESLSGLSMDHVNVHYQSTRPAQLSAHAFAQGENIYLAPGQDHHLPHEAWHVVQQAQGRVKPTLQMKAGVPVNDDKGLETEADLMGKRAVQMVGPGRKPNTGPDLHISATATVQPKWTEDSIDKTGRPIRYWTQTIEDSQDRKNAWYLKTDSDEVGEEVDANQVHIGGKQFYEKSCTATVFAMMKAAKDPLYRTKLIEEPTFAMVEQERILEDLGGMGVPRAWVHEDLKDKIPAKTEHQQQYDSKGIKGDGIGASPERYINTLIKEGVFEEKDIPKIIHTEVPFDEVEQKKIAMTRFKGNRDKNIGEHYKDVLLEWDVAKTKSRETLLGSLCKQVAERGIVHADVGGHSVAIIEAKEGEEGQEKSHRFLIHDPWHDKKAWFLGEELFDSGTIQKRLQLEDVSRSRGIESFILT